MQRAASGGSLAPAPRVFRALDPAPRAGRLADNLVHFGRLLRAAGLPLGPDRVLDALKAAWLVSLERREDFYWALAAVFLDRGDQRELYDRAFRFFWREPGAQLPRQRRPQASGRIAAARSRPQPPARLARAARARGSTPAAPEAAFSASACEVLRTMDFGSMSTAELAAARAAAAALELQLPELPTRRKAPDARGRAIDLRASLRTSVREGGDALRLRRASARRRAAALVALADVSGSMSRYTRMFLHLLHAAANRAERVHVFTFGTRLTNVTRELRGRDPGAALARVARAVSDWSGGTRIGACLGEFNLRWSRRLLGRDAVVLLISDGLDCEGGTRLAREMGRLHRSCRRLVWLNPLLRYPAFEAKPLGIRAMLPHVDALWPAHDLASLERVAAELRRVGGTRATAGRRAERRPPAAGNEGKRG